jgi:CheY-like chemotaxis protein
MTEKPTNLAGKKLMWVEDDVFLNDIISRKCSTRQCDLVHATNGVDAFKLLETERPDIIILDILLPGINGYEILQKIKENEKISDIPVVILSNYGQKKEIERGLNLGAVKYLVKATYTLDEILKQIGEIIEGVENGTINPKGNIQKDVSAPQSVKPEPEDSSEPEPNTDPQL